MGQTARRGGKFPTKPKRGGPRRFTPRSRLENDCFSEKPPSDNEETTDNDEEGSDVDKPENTVERVAKNVAVMNIGCNQEEAAASDKDGESDDEKPTKLHTAHQSQQTQQHKQAKENVPSSAGSKSSHELTRREREAIEKEKARQHYLKMKEKEDAVRLAVIKQRREEEAVRVAAEKSAKEEASRRRR